MAENESHPCHCCDTAEMHDLMRETVSRIRGEFWNPSALYELFDCYYRDYRGIASKVMAIRMVNERLAREGSSHSQEWVQDHLDSLGVNNFDEVLQNLVEDHLPPAVGWWEVEGCLEVTDLARDLQKNLETYPVTVAEQEARKLHGYMQLHVFRTDPSRSRQENLSALMKGMKECRVQLSDQDVARVLDVFLKYEDYLQVILEWEGDPAAYYGWGKIRKTVTVRGLQLVGRNPYSAVADTRFDLEGEVRIDLGPEDEVTRRLPLSFELDRR